MSECRGSSNSMASESQQVDEVSVCRLTKETLDKFLHCDTESCVDMHPFLSLLTTPESAQEAVDALLTRAMQVQDYNYNQELHVACASLCHRAISDLKTDDSAVFKRSLLDTCQQQFMALQQLDPAPEPVSPQKASTVQFAGLLRFMGLLTTKGLVSIAILQDILQALLLDDTR